MRTVSVLLIAALVAGTTLVAVPVASGLTAAAPGHAAPVPGNTAPAPGHTVPAPGKAVADPGVPAVGTGSLSGPAGAPGADVASAGTHGNHLSVDPQVTADGTVVVESVAVLAPTFVVLKADDGGQPGEPVGNALVEPTWFRTDVAVGVDDEAWRGWSGNRTLWAVLHADDGDGTFEPGADPSLAGRSILAEVSYALGRSDDGSVRVLAKEQDPRQLRDGALTVRRVDLANQGYVVAKPIDGDRVVGHRQLDPGAHENVSLSLNESFVDAQRDRFRLRLVAYRDDGDGSFDDGDRPVRVGNESVGTDLVVEKGGANATDTGPQIVTPSPTGSASGDGTAGSPDRDGGRGGSVTETSTATGVFGPGFGVLAAVLGIGFLLLARGRVR